MERDSPPFPQGSSDDGAGSDRIAKDDNQEIIPGSEASTHVMLGRGARSIGNPGNIVFRNIVQTRRAEVCKIYGLTICCCCDDPSCAIAKRPNPLPQDGTGRAARKHTTSSVILPRCLTVILLSWFLSTVLCNEQSKDERRHCKASHERRLPAKCKICAQAKPRSR